MPAWKEIPQILRRMRMKGRAAKGRSGASQHSVVDDEDKSEGKDEGMKTTSYRFFQIRVENPNVSKTIIRILARDLQ